MPNESALITDLRKAFCEAKLDHAVGDCPIFKVEDPVYGEDHPRTVFRVVRFGDRKFVAKIIPISWGGVAIVCYVDDKFCGSPIFYQNPPLIPPAYSTSRESRTAHKPYQDWLENIILAVLKHCEKNK